MPQTIHGHDVLNMMLEATAPYSRESLKAAMAERFGSDAHYHTCCAKNMDADALIDFLAARGKFIPQEDGFCTDESKICKH